MQKGVAFKINGILRIIHNIYKLLWFVTKTKPIIIMLAVIIVSSSFKSVRNKNFCVLTLTVNITYATSVSDIPS